MSQLDVGISTIVARYGGAARAACNLAGSSGSVLFIRFNELGVSRDYVTYSAVRAVACCCEDWLFNLSRSRRRSSVRYHVVATDAIALERLLLVVIHAVRVRVPESAVGICLWFFGVNFEYASFPSMIEYEPLVQKK